MTTTSNRSPRRRRISRAHGNAHPDAAPGGHPTRPQQHGLTGSWFEPATDGQGIELEVFPNLVAPGTSLVQGAWFTFEGAPAGGADRDRWLTFNGNGQSGGTSVAVTIFRNVGGNFDATPITPTRLAGTGTLAFADCSNATLAYTFSDGSGRTGSIALTRLTPNGTCTVGTVPATNADFALSGNWFDAATSGQGVVVDVNPVSPAVFLTWYTYAPAGQALGAAGQRWFVALLKPYVVGARQFVLPLFETTGGVFDQPTIPKPSSAPVGTATLTFASCTSAQLNFNFTGGSSMGRSGTIALSRVGPVPPGCVSAALAIPSCLGRACATAGTAATVRRDRGATVCATCGRSCGGELKFDVGLRPATTSASPRADPHAIVRPSVPCPVFRYRSR
jgi:hypothetical protein